MVLYLQSLPGFTRCTGTLCLFPVCFLWTECWKCEKTRLLCNDVAIMAHGNNHKLGTSSAVYISTVLKFSIKQYHSLGLQAFMASIIRGCLLSFDTIKDCGLKPSFHRMWCFHILKFLQNIIFNPQFYSVTIQNTITLSVPQCYST
jgi:hypothetical protein